MPSKRSFTVAVLYHSEPLSHSEPNLDQKCLFLLIVIKTCYLLQYFFFSV